MTNAQKAYLIKRLKVLGGIAYCVTAIVFAALGNILPWAPYIALAQLGAVALPIAFAMIYVPIATAVWHWRLMGVCENEQEEKVLDAYWFYVYRSENWMSYLRADVNDRYADNEEHRDILLAFIDKLASVKKPRLL